VPIQSPAKATDERNEKIRHKLRIGFAMTLDSPDSAIKPKPFIIILKDGGHRRREGATFRRCAALSFRIQAETHHNLNECFHHLPEDKVFILDSNGLWPRMSCVLVLIGLLSGRMCRWAVFIRDWADPPATPLVGV
jgi:hypothetical protein